MRTVVRSFLLVLAFTLAACGQSAEAVVDNGLRAEAGQAQATFAGGCFWCTESDFEKLDGVIAAQSGYTGGTVVAPTYEQVSGGETGHIEAVRVIFDPKKVSYAELLEHFWRTIDPTDAGGQFCDRGPQYRSAIFAQDDSQRSAAEESRQRLMVSGALKKPVVTEILPAAPFYPAEEYHQDYYNLNKNRNPYCRMVIAPKLGKLGLKV